MKLMSMFSLFFFCDCAFQSIQIHDGIVYKQYLFNNTWMKNITGNDATGLYNLELARLKTIQRSQCPKNGLQMLVASNASLLQISSKYAGIPIKSPQGIDRMSRLSMSNVKRQLTEISMNLKCNTIKHCDLGPHNFVIDDNYRITLIDFDLSCDQQFCREECSNDISDIAIVSKDCRGFGDCVKQAHWCNMWKNSKKNIRLFTRCVFWMNVLYGNVNGDKKGLC